MALLAYLALEGVTTRTRIAGLLWPESPEATARNNLVHRLRRLKERTGSHVIVAGQDLSLSADIHVDAVQLLAAHAAGRHARVIDLSGHLLANADLDELPDYSDWLAAQRERFHALILDAYWRELDRLEAQRDFVTGSALALRLLSFDSLSEEAYRRHMRLAYLAGDRASALKAYERCVTVLRRELGAEPHPDTRALARHIEAGGQLRTAATRAERRGVSLAVMRPPVLVGREDAWARMEEAWTVGRGIVILGEPGAGKSRLAQDFVTAHGGGMRFEGRPGDANVLYGTHARTFRQVLDAYPNLPLDGWMLSELARIVPHAAAAPAPITSESEKVRFWQAKAEVLRAAINRGLRRLTFDDCQFMDDASVQAGGYIFAQLGWGDPAAAYRTIHCFRTSELTPTTRQLLSQLKQANLIEVIELSPLQPHDMHALLEQLDIPGIEALADDLTRYTGGNPFFTLETVRCLVETHQLAQAPTARLPLPDKVSAVVHERLQRLSPAALHAARAASVLRRDFDLDLVAEVLNMPLLETAAAWEELEHAQIVQGSRFHHDIVSETLRAHLSKFVHDLLHRSAARVLAGRGAHPSRIAEHWLEAGQPLHAAPWLMRAAQAAEHTFHLDEAVALYARAAVIFEEHGEATHAHAARHAAERLHASLTVP